MSLRAIHVFVIFLSILLLFFFGFWAISNSHAYLYWGIISMSAGILLVAYLVWFIIKIRRKTV